MAASAIVNKLKSSMVVRVAGGVAVLAVVGGFAAMKFMAHDASQDAPVAVVHHAAHKAAHAPKAGAPAAVNAPSAAGTVNASPASASPRTAVQPVVTASRAAAGDGSGAPVVTAVGQPMAAANPAHLDDHLTYQYNALGRRDPFQSLVDGQFVGADVGGEAPPDPGGIKVVGIVWGANDQFALVEDVRGNSFVLRKGDKVQNGFVEGLKRDGVIVNITAEGQSQSVVIPLTRKGEQNAR